MFIGLEFEGTNVDVIFLQEIIWHFSNFTIAVLIPRMKIYSKIIMRTCSLSYKREGCICYESVVKVMQCGIMTWIWKTVIG